jgi:hypothetical protein
MRENEPQVGPGGKTKLTPELQAKMVEWIVAGNTFTNTCRLVRIAYNTFLDWMRAGEREDTPETVSFYNSIIGAEAECEARIVAQWDKINTKSKDWRSHQALLRDRHKWQPPAQKTETTLQVELSAQPDLSRLTVIELEQYMKLKEQETRLLNKAQGTYERVLDKLGSGDIIDVASESVDILEYDSNPFERRSH